MTADDEWSALGLFTEAVQEVASTYVHHDELQSPE